MKKTGKKLISFILSIVMMVTMLPTFMISNPLTAEAAVKWTPIASSDFSTVGSVSESVDFTPSTYAGGNTMTWNAFTWGDPTPSAANGAVYNPDGYMYLSGYSGGSVPITGHAKWKLDFGFRFKTTNSGDDQYYNSDEYSFLKMYVYGGDLNNPNHKNAGYCYFAQNANGVGYSWEDDGHNVGVQSRTTSITTGNGYLTTGVDYHYVAEFTGTRFRAYITDNSGNMVQKIIDTTESTFISRLNNVTTTTVGSLKIGDDDNSYYFKGLEYRNITFYSGGLASGGSTAADLKSLMNDYESIMQNGPYTNMEAAYSAYVDANEAYDAAVYGNASNSAQITSAYNALSTAIDNMEPWNGYTGTYTPPKGTFNGDSSDASYYAGHYNNLLYLPTGQKAMSGYNDNNYLRVYISTPSRVVALYDGVNIAKYPAMPFVQSNGGNKPRGLSCFYIGQSGSGDANTDRSATNNYIYFDENWHWGGAGNNYDFTWNESQSGEEIPYYYTTNSTSSNCSGTYRALTGHICIKNDNITFANGYSFTTSGTVYFVGRNYNSSLYTYTSQNLNYITMVNYKPVYDLINSSANKAKLADVASYKEGGLASLMSAYTTAQNFNPNTYDYSSSVPAQYNTDMQAVVTAFNNASTTTDNAAQYIALREAIDYEGSPTSLPGNTYSVRGLIADEGYVTVEGQRVQLTGYSEFESKYEAAVAIMAALQTGDYTQGSVAATKATDLMDAFDALSLIVLNAPTVTGQEYLGPNDVITVTDTNNGTAAYKWQYSTDDGANWTDGGNIAAAGGTFTPFNVAAVKTAGTVKIRVVATKSTATEYDNVNGVTHTYFTKPTMSASDGQVVTANTTVNFATTKAGASGTLQYKLDGGSWTPGNSVTVFSGNTTTATLQVKEVTAGGSTSELSDTITLKRKPNEPTVTADGAYLDASHGITVTSNDTALDTDATLMVCSTENGTYVPFTNLVPSGNKYYPFANDTPSGTSMQSDFYVKAVRNGAESDVVHITYSSLGWPSIVRSSDDHNLAANDELTATDTLYLETSTGEVGGTLKYAFSIDGGITWSDAKTANGTITPFAETVTINGNSVNLANKVNISMKAWEERDGSSSGDNVVGPILLKKTEPLTVYYNADSEASTAVITSTDTYNNNGHFFINTDNYEGCAIYYQTKVDGGSWSGFTSYSINGGVDSDTFSTNKIVEIRFFVIENQSKTVFASGEFVHSGNYNELAFKESFDSASASGSTLTLSGTNGTATASTSSGAAADTFSVVDGAGYSDGTNSPDWRNNVLKINSNNNNTYKLALATNPLSTASTAYIAKKNGITISLWRYVPDGKFTNTAEYWTPTLSFSQPQGANGERYYFLTTESAYVTRSDSAIDGNNDYNKYVDIKPDLQDPTQHATGNRRNRWLNVVITVDPTSGVTVYTNGEPHDTTVTVGTGGSHGNYSGNNAALAQDILDFVTNNATTLSFADGEGYWAIGDKDLYLDDIRIYTDVKTQVDINNMYIYDADVKSNITSTSHDPTNVTVYTLARAVETDSNGTKPVGAKVGQEFIDYYGLDATNSSDVSAIDEYSFGTGMTVYHLNKTTGKWDVVGDNAGRCGYQNEKLFGSVYTTGIADALAAATGSGSGAGAGYLVWAPHVMYNLTTDKWVYYGSTSSWGVQKSAIFMCQNDTNDDVTGPYTYKEITYKSTSHPNAIDACVYYGRDANGKPQKGSLNMVFGSWGGSNAIASKQLNANGTTTGNTSYDRIIAAGISETASTDGSSAEGAWVTYENGYYYLYVSYGQNTGSYAERVFRSTTYNDGFIDLANVPATNTENKMKGNQILSPFDMSNYNYTFKSTGHNSIYKTVNNKGEVVTLHSTHARPNTNANHDWIAIPDNALATCQSEVDGNLNLINQVAYNSLGWPVLMPYQYDGTDTVKANIKGEDIEGVYAADDLRTYVSDTWAPQYNYTIVADDDNPNAAYEYGTDEGGDTFTDYIVLSTGADGTRYANYYANKSDYDPENPNNNLAYCGVVGKHGDQICISMICPADREHTWTYRIGNIPHSDEVDSLGESVSMDGVIYTHASTAATNNATFTYALYGTEISDDFQYGTSDLHQGERCTTITTTYPAKIDTSNPTAIYCVSDEAIAKSGDYSGSDFRVVALNDDKWFDEAGNRFSDVQAIDNNGISPNDGTTLKRRYGVKGFVSNYYYNSSTGEYKDTGVELIVSYTDVSTGSNYSEFEFCYVAANPSMAHTVSGSRSEHTYALQGDKRAGIILFDRFLGSTGTATNVRSNYTYQYNWDDSNYYKKGHENGIFNYLGEWGSSASLDDSARDYKTPENMANNFHDSSERVNGRTFASHNSGAFAQIEINRKVYRDAIATSPTVVDTDYYIDYSNEDNYDINNKYGTITTSAGKPTGYTFRMRTSNINWAPQQPRRWGATSYMLNNIVDVKGNKISADATYNSAKGDTLPTAPYQNYKDYSDSLNNDGQGETRLYYGNVNNTVATKNSDNASLESGMGEYSTNTTHHRGRDNDGNQFDFQAKYTLGMGDSAIGRKVMSGYYTNPTKYDELIADSDYYTKGISATGRDSNGNLTFTARSDGRIEKAFDYIDSGNSATNAWNMHIDFSGKNSVEKNTDTSLPAEQYANFILEQGISTMCYWFGTSTRYEGSVHEVYKYYNIGVHTCDKGAARSFAENYLRKRLAVTQNSDGTVTVKRNTTTGAPIYLDASGNETNDVAEAAIITPSNYSLASYQAYIDAVAELNYFVKNPTNTTFGDYDHSGTEPGEANTEYVTAYHDGVPYYVTSKGGANIFGDAGTVYTDKVQAKLIDNVITAYENLFALEDYTKADEIYGKIELLDGAATPETAEDVDTIKVYSDKEAGTVSATYNKANFTEDSWNDFVELIMDVSSAFDYTTASTGKDSWRNVELDGAEYRKLEDILKNANATLLPAVNITDLTSTHTTKSGLVASGVFDGDVQTKTYSSWLALKNECATAYTYLNTSSPGTYARAQTATIPGASVVDGAENEPNFTYTQGQYAVTGVTKCTFDDVTFYARTVNRSAPSAEQALVNTENTTLSAMNLVNADIPAAYESYDSAYRVINSLDMDMYTPAGVTLINNAKINTDKVVYKTLNTDEATAYNTAVAGASLSDGDKLKNTVYGATDAQTVALLTASNTVNDPSNKATYIKKLKISFTWDVDDAEEGAEFELSGEELLGNEVVTDEYYGDTKNFTIPAEKQTDYTVSNWSVTMYPGDSTSEDPFGQEEGSTIKPEGSQKISGYDSFSITRVIAKNMTVYASLTKNENAKDNNRYNIYDVYGKLQDVIYSDTVLPTGDTTTAEILTGVTPKTIPFYTFSKWTVTQKATKVYDVKPTYNVDESQEKYSYTVISGTGEGQSVSFEALYDTRSYINYNGSGTFAAWAVRTGTSGNYKYQIASYSQSYSFFAVTGETYVALVDDGKGGYAPADDTANSITAANIDGQITNTGSNNATELVNNKIKDKIAFVSVSKVYMSSDDKQARVYARITEGAITDGKENLTGYGVLFYNGNADDSTMVIDGTGTYRRAVTNKLDSGQFSYTLNNKSRAFPNNITFRAYVNYDYTYTVSQTSSVIEDQEITINGTDYSKVVVANKNL